MASGERTEKATPKRRTEAREKGQVARSTDLNGAAVVLAGMAAIALTGPQMIAGLEGYLRRSIADASAPGQVQTDGVGHLMLSAGGAALAASAPIAAACLVAAVLANVAQVGLRPSAKALRPDLKRINPLTNFKSMYGVRALFETGKTLWKLVAVGGVVALAVIPRIRELAAATGAPPTVLGQMLADSALAVAWRAAAAYALISAVDYAWQRRRHEKSLRMDREELKQEQRQQNTPPEVRAALRRRAAQMARQRMMTDVPTADVVVTNPTHYAVALRYDGSATAPEVVAKGADLVAARIRAIAREHGVPTVSDPPLARTLHASVDVGQVIPADLYQAVARVLAFVYSLDARTRAARA